MEMDETTDKGRNVPLSGDCIDFALTISAKNADFQPVTQVIKKLME